MNKKLSMAVAGAVMAFGASAANAGIILPAGDWTIDIGGNVNAFYTNTRFSGDLKDESLATDKSHNVIQTGLLPSALGIGGKTRQNDLDVAFQFTFFVGSDSGTGTSGGSNSLNIRQSFLTFGDKSWGTIKMGRDLGIYASDAILSDMTLLGVGSGAGWGGTSTLGRIGSGYQYADWVGQISYASPNWNGFSFNVGLREPWANGNAGDATRHDMGFEGKVDYEWAGDFAGKVWLGGIYQKHQTNSTDVGRFDDPSKGWDLGGKVGFSGAELVGYYYDGENMTGQAALTPNLPLNGFQWIAGGAIRTDDKGGYVQATYKLPIGTKLGLSWGESKSDDQDSSDDFKNKAWVIGAYHPLTKSLNLVAEYTDNKIEGKSGGINFDGKAKTLSLGAIMFF